jgi:FAD/FMN-containing dehydrogenase
MSESAGSSSEGVISFFSPRYGLVCDNVLNYVVVLASGEIVNANFASYQDLTIAHRGGSNNFGIVIAFDINLFPQGDFWGGITVNNINTRAAQFAAFETFHRKPELRSIRRADQKVRLNPTGKCLVHQQQPRVHGAGAPNGVLCKLHHIPSSYSDL